MPSLSLPGSEAGAHATSVAPFEAVQLFTDALLARAILGSPVPERPTLASIYWLDGFHTSSWRRRGWSLSVEELLKRGSAFDSHGAHDGAATLQTLRATIDWSYDLLNVSDRLLCSDCRCLREVGPEPAERVCDGAGVEEVEVPIFDVAGRQEPGAGRGNQRTYAPSAPRDRAPVRARKIG